MYEALQDKLYQDEPGDKISQKELLTPSWQGQLSCNKSLAAMDTGWGGLDYFQTGW